MPRPIKFYMDENVPKPIAEGLRRRGIDVSTAQEAGMLGRSDEIQLNFATREGRVIFTHDTDFLKLHSLGTSHKGIIYTQQQTPIGKIISGLMLIVDVLELDDMEQHVEFI